MTGLSIIVGSADKARFGTALTLAAASAALGARTRMLLDGPAATLATTDSALIETCLDLGAEIVLCQSGLAEADLEARNLDPRFQYGGMVGFLVALGDDRLVIA